MTKEPKDEEGDGADQDDGTNSPVKKKKKSDKSDKRKEKSRAEGEGINVQEGGEEKGETNGGQRRRSSQGNRRLCYEGRAVLGNRKDLGEKDPGEVRASTRIQIQARVRGRLRNSLT